MKTVDPKTKEFKLDLDDSQWIPGQSLTIIALVDQDYNHTLPELSQGDYLGFPKWPERSAQVAITPKKFHENPLHISVDRLYHGYHVPIKGHITGEVTGPVVFMAVKGDPDRSSWFHEISQEDVVAVSFLNKNEPQMAYVSQLLPFAPKLPIENIVFLAFADGNQNRRPDPGEKIGFYGEDELISFKTVSLEPLSGIDIHLNQVVPKPSTDDIILNFEVNWHPSTQKGVIAVARLPHDLTTLSTDHIVSYERVAAAKAPYSLSLKNTGLSEGDQIALFAMSEDPAQSSGLPKLTVGQYLGFYTHPKNLNLAHLIVKGRQNLGTIDASKVYHGFEQRISGQIPPSSFDSEVVVVALKAPLLKILNGGFDESMVLGATLVPRGSQDYELDILPIGENLPLAPVWIFGVEDKNQNRSIDPGETLLSYVDEKGEPLPLHLSGPKRDEISLTKLAWSVPDSQKSGTLLQVTIKDTPRSKTQNGPTFIIITKPQTENDWGQMEAKDIIGIFERPKETDTITLDLAPYGVEGGDSVMVTALKDHDYTGGFPSLTDGDDLGVALDKDTFEPKILLKTGEIQKVEISLHRRVAPLPPAIEFHYTSSYRGEILVLAYQGGLPRLHRSELKPEAIVAMGRYQKSDASIRGSLPILPFAPLPIPEVYLMILEDKNGNARLDPGEVISNYGDDFPRKRSLSSSGSQEWTISSGRAYEPGYGHPILISGQVTGHVSHRPSHILVVKASTPIPHINFHQDQFLAYERLEPGNNQFTIDLSLAPIAPGERIMVIAVQDLDQSDFYPQMTKGDSLGFYQSDEEEFPGLIVKESSITGLEIPLNQSYQPHQPHLSGTIKAQKPGQVILALCRCLRDDLRFDLFTAKNDAIIAAKVMEHGGGIETYSLPLLPIDHLRNRRDEDLLLIALYDENRNFLPDPGEEIGYASDELAYPIVFDLPPHDLTELAIKPQITLPIPAYADIAIKGELRVREDFDGAKGAVFLAVLEATSVELDIKDGVDFKDIKAIKRMAPSADEFYLDLSHTDLEGGDDIIVVALWDQDYEKGLPRLSYGDHLALLQNPDQLRTSYTLNDSGVTHVTQEAGWRFEMSLAYIDHDASLGIALSDLDYSDSSNPLEVGDQVLLYAVVGDAATYSSDSLQLASFDEVVGIGSIEFQGSSQLYPINVLDFLNPDITFPNEDPSVLIEEVMIVGIIDQNRNGQGERDEFVGIWLGVDLSPSFTLFNRHFRPEGGMVFNTDWRIQ